MKTGSGLTHHTIDRTEKYVSIGFAGDDDEQCYRNDASVLFFAANSYLTSYCILADELDRRFTSDVPDKRIEHLIMPYYFTFRHYAELELKAIFICVEEENPGNSHCLNTLFKKVSSSIKKHPQTANDTLLLNLIQNLGILISQYEKLESAVEYFRYIFDQNYDLPNSTLSLRLTETNPLFSQIVSVFRDIINRLIEDDIYVYHSL